MLRQCLVDPLDLLGHPPHRWDKLIADDERELRHGPDEAEAEAVSVADAHVALVVMDENDDGEPRYDGSGCDGGGDPVQLRR